MRHDLLCFSPLLLDALEARVSFADRTETALRVDMPRTRNHPTGYLVAEEKTKLDSLILEAQLGNYVYIIMLYSYILY